MKKIAIMHPREQLSSEQVRKLGFAGEVQYLEQGKESLKDMIRIAKDAEFIGYSPSKIGKGSGYALTQILAKAPNVKGVAFDTPSMDCIDKTYVEERGIRVFTIKDFDGEAVAESTIAHIFNAGLRIHINERRTFRRRYVEEVGSELRGQTLGILGMQQAGDRVADIALTMGMTVLTWDKEKTRKAEVQRGDLGSVLAQADYLAILLPNTDEYEKFLSKEWIGWLNSGTKVINMAGRRIVDEKAMSEALKQGRVDQYIFEGDTIGKSPLGGIETAIMLKPFSTLTKQTEVRRKNAWVKAVADLSGHFSS